MEHRKQKPAGPSSDNTFRDGDPRLVDVENPGERAYWRKTLLMSDDELYCAVAAVGNSAQKVKDWAAARRVKA